MSLPNDIFPRTRGQDCLSDLVLDRLARGELQGTSCLTEVQTHLESCRRCQQRQNSLRADERRFAENVAVDAHALRVRRAARSAAWRWRLVGFGTATAAAATVLLWLGPSFNSTRIKGREQLSLVVKQPDGRIERVGAGDTLMPGDAIRFAVSTQESVFVAIVGIDSSPAVMPYWPRTAMAAKVGAGRKQLMDGSIVLDDTLGAERVVAVFCDDVVAVDRIVEAAQLALEQAGQEPRRVAELKIAKCREDSLVFEKAARP